MSDGTTYATWAAKVAKMSPSQQKAAASYGSGGSGVLAAPVPASTPPKQTTYETFMEKLARMPPEQQKSAAAIVGGALSTPSVHPVTAASAMNPQYTGINQPTPDVAKVAGLQGQFPKEGVYQPELTTPYGTLYRAPSGYWQVIDSRGQISASGSPGSLDSPKTYQATLTPALAGHYSPEGARALASAINTPGYSVQGFRRFDHPSPLPAPLPSPLAAATSAMASVEAAGKAVMGGRSAPGAGAFAGAGMFAGVPMLPNVGTLGGVKAAAEDFFGWATGSKYNSMIKNGVFVGSNPDAMKKLENDNLILRFEAAHHEAEVGRFALKVKDYEASPTSSQYNSLLSQQAVLDATGLNIEARGKEMERRFATLGAQYEKEVSGYKSTPVYQYGEFEKGSSDKIKSIFPEVPVPPNWARVYGFGPFQYIPEIAQVYSDVRERPVTTAISYGIGVALPLAFGGVSSLGRVSGVTEAISKFPAGAEALDLAPKAIMSFIGVTYAQSAGERITGIPMRAEPGKQWLGADLTKVKSPEAMATEARKIATTEIVPAALGGLTGIGMTQYGSGLFRTRGTTEIPLETIGFEPKEGFAISNRITARSLTKSFEEHSLFPYPDRMSITGIKPETLPSPNLLPGELPSGKVMWTGWTDQPTIGKFTVGKGSSEITGIYGSPTTQTYFTKVVGSNSGINLFSVEPPMPGRPSILHTEVSGFELLPKKLRGASYGEINEFLATEKTPGVAYLPLRKAEYESVLPQGNVLDVAKPRFHVRVGGMQLFGRKFGQIRVPIFETKATGNTVAIQPEVPRVKGSRPIAKMFSGLESKGRGYNPFSVISLRGAVSLPDTVTRSIPIRTKASYRTTAPGILSSITSRVSSPSITRITGITGITGTTRTYAPSSPSVRITTPRITFPTYPTYPTITPPRITPPYVPKTPPPYRPTVPPYSPPYRPTVPPYSPPYVPPITKYPRTPSIFGGGNGAAGQRHGAYRYTEVFRSWTPKEMIGIQIGVRKSARREGTIQPVNIGLGKPRRRT